MRRAVTILIVIFFSWAYAMAQNCATYALVAAYDKKTGDDIDHLKAEDFRAYLGGHEIPILSLTQQFSHRLLVLVETDGRRSQKVEEAVSLATSLARQAPAGTPMAFGAFAKRSIFTDGFIGDEQQRAKAISSVIEEADTLGRRVALYNALHKALALFGPHQPGDTVILISDGYDEDSNRSGSEVEHEFEAHGTRLMVMFRQPPSHVFGNFNWNPPEHDRAILQNMSSRTGGIYSMLDAYSFSLAWHGYLVEVRIPEGINKPKPWKLRLRENAWADARRTRIYYPEKILPCSTEPAAQAR
jgi:hypothetical protein